MLKQTFNKIYQDLTVNLAFIINRYTGFLEARIFQKVLYNILYSFQYTGLFTIQVLHGILFSSPVLKF